MKKASFAERLAQALDERGMRPATLSELSGVSKSTISNYLSGRFEAKYERVAQFAAILECSTQWLLGQETPKKVQGGEGEPSTLPLLGSVAAGAGIFAEGNLVRSEYAEPKYCDGEHFYLQVEGDSMSPMLSSGDLLLCRLQETLENGMLGVFVIDGEAGVVKCYREAQGRITLLSFNQNWAPICFSGGDIDRLRIVGRVVKSIRSWE